MFLCQDCGLFEFKTESVIRSVKDYCVLFEKENFIVDDILDFIANQISRSGVIKIISENFEVENGFSKNVYKSGGLLLGKDRFLSD